ncbi:MAG: ribosomal-protein-alanine N-acetyltransferase [Desulforhopalus sp.]|jgi:ribosomal-protein-alanine N-acetyltransferase
MFEADAPVVERLEQQTSSPWSLTSLLGELKQDRGVVIVAELTVDQGTLPEVVGWCACRYLVPESELLKIAVSSDHRRRGIATALLRHLTLFLSQRSIETLFLEVRSQNQRALKFYKKSGFLQIGQRSKYYSNPNDDASIFRKIL